MELVDYITHLSRINEDAENLTAEIQKNYPLSAKVSCTIKKEDSETWTLVIRYGNHGELCYWEDFDDLEDLWLHAHSLMAGVKICNGMET